MKLQNLSIRRFLLILAAAACPVAVFCLMTGSGIFALYGAFLAAMFVWGIVFLKFFQRKLYLRPFPAVYHP